MCIAVVADRSLFGCILQYNLAAEDMSKMQQIDLKDTDANYAVDCRDDSVLVSKYNDMYAR